MNKKIALDQQFATILQDGIIVIDKNRMIRWHNPMAKKLLKLPKDCQGKNITQWLDKNILKTLPRTRKHFKTIELPSTSQKNTYWSVEVLAYQANNYIVIIRDVTHTHHLEMMRQDFVANVSHELRTPLTVLRGYLENFVESKSKSLQSSKAIFQQMHQQTMRMERIVEDLLLLSQLETNLPAENKRETIDINLLLQQILNDARALSGNHQHKISLQIVGPKKFIGNKTELRSAFSNLVFNAVYYTPDYGNIEMRWYRDKEGIHFSVQDTGMGIDPKHIPRLTERFYRVDPGRTRKTGGTGLGLAIVKHVLIRHHGQLHIESKINTGSLFRCDFPLDEKNS